MGIFFSQKWFQNIDSSSVCEKLRAGGQICLVHFEDHFIENSSITPSAIPTLGLKLSNKGNTTVDYEELLLSAKSPAKKKRGTSGNLPIPINDFENPQSSIFSSHHQD
jgi:hypothetical protein